MSEAGRRNRRSGIEDAGAHDGVELRLATEVDGTGEVDDDLGADAIEQLVSIAGEVSGLSLHPLGWEA